MSRLELGRRSLVPAGNTSPEGLVYHAGGLGDLILSLPAIFRLIQAKHRSRWAYWGPTDRLCILPGFLPGPAPLLRHGHTLWGATPDPEALAVLAAASCVLAFSGREPPPWVALPEFRGFAVSSFPPPGGAWVPLHQERQLTRLGAPRLGRPWLSQWREAVLPGRNAEAILIHPGSGDRSKNLPVEVWQAVGESLREVLGLPVRVLQGPVEAERSHGDSSGWNTAVVTRCEGLRDLLAALCRAALFLGNDAGPTHLAGALGVPTLAVFGPTDPGLWRPMGPRVRCLSTSRDCAPCTAGGPIHCLDRTCLTDHCPEAIVAAALEVLATPNGGMRPGKEPG